MHELWSLTPARMLEDELESLLRRAHLAGRQARAVARRIGWDGRGGTTLAVAAAGEGYTRERVRQLEQRLVDVTRKARPWLPVTESALATIRSAAPAGRAEVAKALHAVGLTRLPFDPAGVIRAAQLAGIEPRIELANDAVFVGGQQSEATSVLRAARRRVSGDGATTVRSVAHAAGLPAGRTRRLLELEPAVSWLDAERDWLYLDTPRNRAATAIRKMLSLEPALSVADLRDGLRRGHRRVDLPEHVVRALCLRLDGIGVEADRVAATTRLDYRTALPPVERMLVEIFRAHGPVLDRLEAISLAERGGVNATTARLYLNWSPALRALPDGRCALRTETTVPVLAERAA